MSLYASQETQYFSVNKTSHLKMFKETTLFVVRMIRIITMMFLEENADLLILIQWFI
jgi:hypothetical protein